MKLFTKPEDRTAIGFGFGVVALIISSVMCISVHVENRRESSLLVLELTRNQNEIRATQTAYLASIKAERTVEAKLIEFEAAFNSLNSKLGSLQTEYNALSIEAQKLRENAKKP